MGYGDEIIGTGLARGARARGKRIAFGDGRRIIWGPWCTEMFANNPNIAWPGTERSSDIEWCDHYKGNRKYNKLVNGRWEWNYKFKVTPGEIYFSDIERMAKLPAPGYVVVEPNVPWQKTVAPNKDWGAHNYRELSSKLKRLGLRIVQFQHKNSRRILQEAELITTHKFREALWILSHSSLYVGPEGGMHHAAGALGIRAVVLFGGFIPPSIMGYPGHVCLTGNVKDACGNINHCEHCREAMESIAVDDVVKSIRETLACQ